MALYNRVRETILDVEQPLTLIEGQQLERVISDLNWTSEGWGGGERESVCLRVCVCGGGGGGGDVGIEMSYPFPLMSSLDV